MYTFFKQTFFVAVECGFRGVLALQDYLILGTVVLFGAKKSQRDMERTEMLGGGVYIFMSLNTAGQFLRKV